MKQIEVVAAIIRKGDKIFATLLDSIMWLSADWEVVEKIRCRMAAESEG